MNETLCPECGTKVLPVIWGMPNLFLVEKAERGEVILGGFAIEHYDKKCPECGWKHETFVIGEWYTAN